jgi:hypothetical protein
MLTAIQLSLCLSLSSVSQALSPHPESIDPAVCQRFEEVVNPFLIYRYKSVPKVDTYLTRVRIGKKWRRVAREEDFTWKDAAAAAHAHTSLEHYLLDKVDTTFKVELYWLIRTAEENGLPIGIHSLFRDDYRQSLITVGTKARVGFSFHGGSMRGGICRAADLVAQAPTHALTLKHNDAVYAFIDRYGSRFDIVRPYGDKDAGHVAPRSSPEFAMHHRSHTKVATAKHHPHQKRHIKVASK